MQGEQEAAKEEDKGFELPEWLPLAAGLLAFLVAAALAISSFTSPAPAPPPQPKVKAATPTVVKVAPAVAADATAAMRPSAAPTSAPASAPSPAVPRAAPQAAPQAAPKPKPAPAPPPALPDLPAPPLAPSMPLAARPPPILVRNDPTPSMLTPEQQELPTKVSRQLTSATAELLRSAADGLPGVERALENQAPALQSGASKIVSGDLDKALPVIGNAVGNAAEMIARTGLKAVSIGLGTAAETLPAAGQVVDYALEAAMPTVLDGVHNAAGSLRGFAGKIVPTSDTPTEKIAPGLLNITASGLDALADSARDAKNLAGYVANKAMPVAQAGLRASAQVSSDLAGVPLPQGEQVVGTLKAVGIDPDKIGAQAKELARQAADTAQEKIQAKIGQPTLAAASPASVVKK